jgi:hypothetical protein
MVTETLERERLDNDLFEILHDHLTGVGQGILRARLAELCNDEKHGGKSALTLYQDARISAHHAAKLKKLLCVNTEITEPESLFDWIKTLSQNNYGHRHLEDFYYLLQEVNPRKSWATPLFLTTLATGLGATYLYFMPAQLKAFEGLISQALQIAGKFLEKTFSVLKNIPLVLLIYNAARIPLQTYHSLVHDTFRTLPKRLQKWGAGTLPSVFSLISYALCYVAGGVFTPLAVGFFIASSLVAVVSSLFNLRQLKLLEEKPALDAPLEIQLDYLRQEERQNRTKNTILVNFLSSASISAVVILWALLPPSFLVMVGSIMLINLVGFTKNAMLNRFHTKGAEHLQKTLHAVTRDDEALQQATPTPSTETTHDLLEETKALRTEVSSLREEIKSCSFFRPAPSNQPSSQPQETQPEVPSELSIA